MAASAEKYFAFKHSFTETKITANIRLFEDIKSLMLLSNLLKILLTVIPFSVYSNYSFPHLRKILDQTSLI